MSRAAAFNPAPAESLATTKLRIRPHPRALKAIDPKKPPAELSPGALVQWHHIAPQLAEAGLAAVIDSNVLAVYCEVRARWLVAEKKVTELGPVVRSPQGTPGPNPFLRIANEAIRQLSELGTQLGMSPAARDELRRRKS